METNNVNIAFRTGGAPGRNVEDYLVQIEAAANDVKIVYISRARKFYG